MNGGEAAHAGAAQGDPPNVLAQQLDHGQRIVDRTRSEDAVGAPVPARVVGQRRHAFVAAAAAEVEVALLGRAGAVHDHHAHVGLARGQEERVGQAVVNVELGRRG